MFDYKNSWKKHLLLNQVTPDLIIPKGETK